MAKGGKTGGRKPGTPNRATADVRATIALVAERNVSRLEEWLDRVAEDDPEKAADLFLRMIEYHVPKLARSEMKVEGDVQVSYVARMPQPAKGVDDWLERSK